MPVPSGEIIQIRSQGKLREILGFDFESLERIANQAARYYRQFQVTSKSGKARTISAPIDPLKKIQKKIDGRILKKFPLPSRMTGSVRSKSIKDHAQIHTGHGRGAEYLKTVFSGFL